MDCRKDWYLISLLYKYSCKVTMGLAQDFSQIWGLKTLYEELVSLESLEAWSN